MFPAQALAKQFLYKSQIQIRLTNLGKTFSLERSKRCGNPVDHEKCWLRTYVRICTNAGATYVQISCRVRKHRSYRAREADALEVPVLAHQVPVHLEPR